MVTGRWRAPPGVVQGARPVSHSWRVFPSRHSSKRVMSISTLNAHIQPLRWVLLPSLCRVRTPGHRNLRSPSQPGYPPPGPQPLSPGPLQLPNRSQRALLRDDRKQHVCARRRLLGRTENPRNREHSIPTGAGSHSQKGEQGSGNTQEPSSSPRDRGQVALGPE